MSKKKEEDLDPRVVRDRERTGEKLGEAIARAREDAKLTQEKVGARFGVSRQMIGQYEANISTLGANDLVRLAAILQTTVASLFKFEKKLCRRLESLSLTVEEDQPLPKKPTKLVAPRAGAKKAIP